MGTVSKALTLLNFFSRARTNIGLTEMTKLSGMNKATVYRLLSELQEQGFVEQVGSGREYRLGPVFLRLAALREVAVPMREIAQDVLSRISEKTGETAHFSLLQGDRLGLVTCAYSLKHGTRVTMDDAEVIPLHSTSSGLAVLAYSTPAFVDEALSKPLERYTQYTVIDPDKLRLRLRAAQDYGFAESVSGFEEDVHSHACPVFDARQVCIGAVAVAAPVARMDDALKEIIRSTLMASTLELTRLLGGFAPEEFKEKVAA
jgi:DNA-binding IclR family transcriptional regulator